MRTLRVVSTFMTGAALAAVTAFASGSPAIASEPSITAEASAVKGIADVTDYPLVQALQGPLPTSTSSLEADADAETLVKLLVELDGLMHLDYQAANAAAVDEWTLDQFVMGFTSAGGVVDGGPAELRDSTAASANSCAGRQQYWVDVWGAHFELNTCTVSAIHANAQVVAFVTGILAAIPGAQVAAPVVAATIAHYAGVLSGCAFPNGIPVGATLHLTPAFWCGTQA
jgi:hypothetical protein